MSEHYTNVQYMNLADLKLALAPTPSQTVGTPLATGWPDVDALLGGGLGRGRVIEIAGGRSSGKLALALAAAARATVAGQLCAFVDPRGELYPPSAAALGVDLTRLLVVRPSRGAGAIAIARAAEIVARSRAFALIVVDLPAGQRLPDQIATRLRSAAHETGAAVVALTGSANAVPHAAVRLDVSASDEQHIRRLMVRIAKGGALPPGSSAVVHLGEPLLGSAFRPASRQAALAAAAPGALLRRTR